MAAAIAESKKTDKTSRERAELEKIQVLSFPSSPPPLPRSSPTLLLPSHSYPTPDRERDLSSSERDTYLHLRESRVFL